jgi:hypothetical protein
MKNKEVFQIIDVLRAHAAADLHLDSNSFGQNVKSEIGHIAEGVFYTASYDELADLLYLAMIEKVLQ